MWLTNYDGSVCSRGDNELIGYSDWSWVSACPSVCAVVPIGISKHVKDNLDKYRLAQEWDNVRLCLLSAADGGVEQWECLKCKRRGNVRDAIHSAGSVLLYGS